MLSISPKKPEKPSVRAPNCHGWDEFVYIEDIKKHARLDSQPWKSGKGENSTVYD